MIKMTFAAVMVVMLFCGLPLDASAKEDVIELKFSSTVPPMVGLGKAQLALLNKIQEESGGKVKVVPYWANSLLKPREIFRGVMTGVVDMAFWVVNIDLGMMKLNTVTGLPMLGFPSEKAFGDIHAKLVKKFPKMQAEFKGVIPYGITTFTPAEMNTIGKQVLVPSDMKGMKIAPSNPDTAQLVLAGGGAPVNLVVTDWYTSAEKGLVDGFINVTGALIAFKVMDLIDHHTLFKPGGLSSTMCAILINPDVLNDLPPDVQKTLRDYEAVYVDNVLEYTAEDTKKAIGYAKMKKHTITVLTPKDKEWALWEEAAKPVHEKWIAKHADIGGKEVYEETLRLINADKGQ